MAAVAAAATPITSPPDHQHFCEVAVFIHYLFIFCFVIGFGSAPRPAPSNEWRSCDAADLSARLFQRTSGGFLRAANYSDRTSDQLVKEEIS